MALRLICKGNRDATPDCLLRTSRMDTSTPMSETEADSALLPILIAPHKALKTKARAVVDADMDRVRALVPRMFASMYRAPGIGLAAPQVDVGLRVAVIDLQTNDVRRPIAMINPEILRVSEEWAAREEGCLSLPNQFAEVSRPAAVRVRYTDLDGKRHDVDAEGLLSACLQHEIDHLDGVLFIDHLSALKRNIVMRRLAKEQKQKASA